MVVRAFDEVDVVVGVGEWRYVGVGIVDLDCDVVD